MCTRTPDPSPAKTERERLEEALARPSVRDHEWCLDGKVIIEAARKHLATLPKPMKYRLYIDGNPTVTFDSKDAAVMRAESYLRYSYSTVAIREE